MTRSPFTGRLGSKTAQIAISLSAPERDAPKSSVLQILKLVAWPIVVVIFFILFRHPVSSFVASLDSVKGSVAGMTVELHQIAAQRGQPELARLIEGLSANAIAALLKLPGAGKMESIAATSDNNALVMPTDENFSSLDELLQKGLVRGRDRSTGKTVTSLKGFLTAMRQLPLERERFDDAFTDVRHYAWTRAPSQSEAALPTSLVVGKTPNGDRATEIVVALVQSQVAQGKGSASSDRKKDAIPILDFKEARFFAPKQAVDSAVKNFCEVGISKCYEPRPPKCGDLVRDHFSACESEAVDAGMPRNNNVAFYSEVGRCVGTKMSKHLIKNEARLSVCANESGFAIPGLLPTAPAAPSSGFLARPSAAAKKE